MSRPHRPNLFEGPRLRQDPRTMTRIPESHREWLSMHVKQETFKERAIRLRKEANERQAHFDSLSPQQKADRQTTKARKEHYLKAA